MNIPGLKRAAEENDSPRLTLANAEVLELCELLESTLEITGETRRRFRRLGSSVCEVDYLLRKLRQAGLGEG